jgi:hypothetical protein
MYSVAIAVFIFLFILFSYIHIIDQWKTSDDLELYESELISLNQMQGIVAVKQPVLFSLSANSGSKIEDRIREFLVKFQLARMEKYDNVDVRIKDTNDYFGANRTVSTNSVEWVNLPLRSAQTLLSTDTNAKYFSENNVEFMEDTGLNRFAAAHLDPIMRPPLAVLAKYDIQFGSPQSSTPLRHHNSYQRYLVVCSGKMRVKMCPPKYRKVLEVQEDFDYYEFWSPLRVWSRDPQHLAKRDRDILDRIKMLEFEVPSGHALFVPPYWWYSIRFSGDANTTVCSATYDTPASIAANAKPLAIHFMQQTQTTKVMTKVRTNVNIQNDDQDSEKDPDPDHEITPGFKSGFEMHEPPQQQSNQNQQNQKKPKPEIEMAGMLKKPMASAPFSENQEPTEIITNAGVYKLNG